MSLDPTRRGVIAAAPALLAPATARAAPELRVERDDMTLGSPRARVTVIEYASASCPHCARFNNEVFPGFKAQFIDTGRVFYVFREFLTEPVSLAAVSFLIARCAGPARYFGVLDEVFHAQAGIYASGDAKPALVKIAAGAGIDEKAFDACLDDQKRVDALNARVRRYVERDGIRSTPTFLVNGARLEGEQTLDALSAAVASAEAAAPHRRRRG